MRVLITGAQGFVGRYLAAEVLANDAEAEIVGTGRSPRRDGCFSHELAGSGRARLPTGLERVPDGRFRYVRVDLLDGDAMRGLLAGFAPEWVFHMASGLRDDPDGSLVGSNVAGTSALMSAIGASGLRPRVVQGSSGGVYGRVRVEQLPLTEDARTDPADVYAATKLAAEQIGCIVGRRHGVPVMVARIFNIVGAGQDERHVCGRLARDIFALMQRGGTELSVGSLQTTRDFVDVRDVARALVLLARRGEPDSLYNVGSGVETAVRDVVQRLATIAGYQGEWCEFTAHARPSDVPRHCADISRLRALGFAPRYTLSASLQEVYKYYADRDAATAVGPSSFA